MEAIPTVCGTFAQARAYPLVVARWQGSLITVTACVGAALGVAAVWATRWLWGPLAGPNGWWAYPLAALVGGVFTQSARLDGRAPLWTLATWARWATGAAWTAGFDWWQQRPLTVSVPHPARAASRTVVAVSWRGL